jgi:hypothetical protein
MRADMDATMTSQSRLLAACAIGAIALLSTPTSPLAAQHPVMQHPTAAKSVLAVAQRAAALIPDTAAARAAGFVPIEELGIPDGNPFQGQHWYSAQRADTLPDVPLATPAFVMFAPVNGTLQRIAVAYSARLLIEAATPTALAGDSSAMWHAHVLCRLPSPSGRPIIDQVPDTSACRAGGGVLVPRKTVMVHVWTDIPNPVGIYGHDNPALPFIVLGLTPPEMSDLHDPVRSRAVRALALALGEAYGAQLENAYLIERANNNVTLVDSLRVHRSAIAALVPQLRRGDVAHDRSLYDRVAARLRAEGTAVERIYEQMATSGARALLRRQYEATLTTSAMM